MKPVAMICVLATLSLPSSPVSACTILAAVQDGRVLVGNNEDATDPFIAVQVIPATDAEHGRICFGFNTGGERLATLGGVNEHGLFIDGNGVSATDWAPVEGRETYRGIAEAHILAHCATVDEALAWFRSTNVAILARGKFLLADRSGASAVVEWSQGGLQVIPREGDFQVSTNFRQSEQQPGVHPCYRYRTAEALLQEADTYSVDLVRRILSLTHFEGSGSTTLYSYICDLEAGRIHVYNFHHFEDVVVLDVAEELARGPSLRPLPMLFPHIPYAQHCDVPRKLSSMLERVAGRRTIDELIAGLGEMNDLALATYGRDHSESIVNSLGYDFLADERVDDAVRVLRFNVSAHPESANVYDSLGEAYLVRGDTLQAVANYRESLARDPGNANAVEVLRRLE